MWLLSTDTAKAKTKNKCEKTPKSASDNGVIQRLTIKLPIGAKLILEGLNAEDLATMSPLSELDTEELYLSTLDPKTY